MTGSDTFWRAFWSIHHDLPREGPGEPEDVFWAVDMAGAGSASDVLDAGCGPGGDIAALLEAMPDAQITALDKHADFIEAVVGRFSDDRVVARQSDMRDVSGPFDFIWSAGAVYFLGLSDALMLWKKALTPGGAIAFSHPVFFTGTPSEAARAFWEGEDAEIGTAEDIGQEITAAGFETIAARPVSDSAWEAYYRPLEARIDAMGPAADPALADAINATRAEIEGWRAVKAETGYLLSVVRPL